MKPTPLSDHLQQRDVARLVTLFYRRVRSDPLLAPHFMGVDDWPAHEQAICDFWWGLMGGHIAQPKPRAMERAHRDLRFGEEELQRWLALFEQTLQENLPAEPARQWSAMARQIGERMARRGLLHSRA